MSNSSLATIQVPAYSGNYTRGRGGHKIQKITIHHMAGHSTAKQCGKIFQRVGRKGSTHYGIGYNGEIAQYVDEANTAWADANSKSNRISVTFETANSSTGGNWPVNDVTLNSVIKLCADIAIRNNLGPLVPGKNLTWHSMYSSTACPGPYLKSKMGYIAAEANKIIAGEDNYNPPQAKPQDYQMERSETLGYSVGEESPDTNIELFQFLSDAKNYAKAQYLINNDNKKFNIWEIIQEFTVNYSYTEEENNKYKCTVTETAGIITSKQLENFDVETYTYIENPDNPKSSTTSILLKQFKGGNGE